MCFAHFHCYTRRGWLGHCGGPARVEMSIEIDDDAGPWFFCAFHRPGRESIYVGGWWKDGPPSTKQMVLRPIVFRPTIQQQQQTLSNLFDKCLADCVCCLSLTYSSQRVLIIIDTFYTRLRLSAALCIGEHRTGSSPVPVGIISVSFYHHCCVLDSSDYTHNLSVDYSF